MTAWTQKSLAAALTGSMALVYFLPRPAPAPTVVEPLEGWPEIARPRWVAKDKLASEAAAGRRPLLEAAAMFAALDRLPPAAFQADADALKPLPIPVRTDAGRHCAQVIHHARVALKEDAVRLAAAEARLVAEFEDALLAHGAIRLPDESTLEPAEDLIRQARAWIAEQDERRAARTGPPPAAH
jgi:hypothetical protein